MTDALRLLFLCGGRRVELLRRFRAALSAHGGGSLFITDTTRHPASSFVADQCYLVPPCSDLDAFADAVAHLCTSNAISAIIPLRCAAIRAIPAIRSRTTTTIICADNRSIAICTDRIATAAYIAGRGVPTPEVIYGPTPRDLPLFVRPRHGEGGAACGKLMTPAMLAESLAQENTVFTRYVPGREFSVDCYWDFSHRLVGMIPRERLRVRAGEVERSVTRQAEALAEACRTVCGGLRIVGPCNIQAIESSGVYYITEVNLRFGGGATLAIEAGLHVPTWLMSELRGEALCPMIQPRWGLAMARYDSEFYFLAQGEEP